MDLYLDYWIKDSKTYWEDDREFYDAKFKNILNEKQIEIVEKTKIELEINALKLEKEKQKILFD